MWIIWEYPGIGVEFYDTEITARERVDELNSTPEAIRNRNKYGYDDYDCSEAKPQKEYNSDVMPEICDDNE